MNGNHGSTNWQWLSGISNADAASKLWKHWYWISTQAISKLLWGDGNGGFRENAWSVVAESLTTASKTYQALWPLKSLVQPPIQSFLISNFPSIQPHFGSVTKHCCPSYRTYHYTSYSINIRTDSSFWQCRCQESKRGRSVQCIIG